MPIAFESFGVGSGGSGAAMAIVAPATVNANDLLLVVGGVVSTTDFGTNPANWNDLGNATHNAAMRGRFWYKLAVGDEDGTTVSFPHTAGSTKTGLMARYSGVNPASIFDATGAATGDATETYQASVTVVGSNRTVVLMMYIDGTSGVTEANATFTGTGGITFRARHYVGGDLAVIGDGVLSAGTHTVGFTSDAAGNDARNAVLQAVSLNPISQVNAPRMRHYSRLRRAA